MKLYDSVIAEVEELLLKNNDSKHTYTFSPDKDWPQTKDFELIFQRDAAFELGGAGKMSANLTTVTTTVDQVRSDEIFIYGSELSELNMDTSFARITQVVVNETDELEDTDKLYNILQDIDFVKYHIFPLGYMVRVSGQTHKEQVRVGKQALADGLSFERIGNTMIKRYKQNPHVKCVRITFITMEDFDYQKLTNLAVNAYEIKNSLSKINKGMPTECSSCGIKEICNEVEGLRELHFGKKEKKKPECFRLSS